MKSIYFNFILGHKPISISIKFNCKFQSFQVCLILNQVYLNDLRYPSLFIYPALPIKETKCAYETRGYNTINAAPNDGQTRLLHTHLKSDNLLTVYCFSSLLFEKLNFHRLMPGWKIAFPTQEWKYFFYLYFEHIIQIKALILASAFQIKYYRN